VYLDKLLAAQKDHASAHELRGRYFQHKGELVSAIGCYDHAIAIDSQFAAAHFHRGTAKLAQGDYIDGWDDFEWRMKIPGAKTFSLPHPQWRGEDISGKTLLVLTEANPADAIFFARFLPMAKQRCRKLILICDESLKSLFKGVACVDEVRVHGKLQIDLFDVYTPMMSLAAVLKMDAAGPVTQFPDFAINTLSSDRITSTRPKVGLVWSGDSPHVDNARVSCPLADVIALTAIRDVDFYSFQTPLFAADRTLLHEHGVTDLEPEQAGFTDTGALLQHMDLLVSVPSTTAHLAGALGVPAVVLISDPADWRWASDGTASTWYPSVQVLQRTAADGWHRVLALCAERINKLVT
jgi:hypothetical protein